MSGYFLKNQTAAIKEYYDAYGYVVIQDAIPVEKITAFHNAYEAFKTSKNYYFLSQDTNQIEKLEINSQGFIEHSILNPIDLVFQNTFNQAALNIITLPQVSQLLTTLSDRQQHIIWQTMFFDKSTGTVAHQDHYYLDSDPPGNLIACWFALEDIHADAGAFFVIPKSHKGKLITRNANHDHFSNHEEYVSQIQTLIKEENYQPQAMLLKKGSILCWHPYLIHGAFPNQNPQYSRKSLTAHFLPEGYGRLGKNLPTQISSENPDILVWKKTIIERLKASIRHFRFQTKYHFRNKKTRAKMEMRSSEYEEVVN
ncbi:phytanoyl-CoA dioxygenase family protein [Calothrix sp. UHCC 0171]|uniref:phytanoyl-CoA dioxygenase family protein n=1 Tax=Calothrix sp. UHCC 0171 TaxID=3110245 RepID=UPI002B1E9E50|nr:phytanoyl-CoA dioxygenase family protein [Calothrix sp. UHCC 0171]MEA5573376.1 phytanoyl-CoA dioxygenase family protein [Calothrix sp. UHCC 0171]